MEVVRAALRWRREDPLRCAEERPDPPRDPPHDESAGRTPGPSGENRATTGRTHPGTHLYPPRAATRDATRPT